MFIAARTAALVGVLLALSGCEPGASELTVKNETDQPITLVKETGVTTSAAPDGGTASFLIDECSTREIRAIWPDGTIVATLDEQYCNGQVWIISGVDEATLQDE